MKKYLNFLVLVYFFSCSNHSPQRQEEVYQETDKEVVKAINSGTFASLQEATRNKNLEGASELHNYLASKCSSQLQKVNEQMAITLIKKGAKPIEQSFQDYKGPLKTTLSRGCASLLSVYLDNMSHQDIAQASLDLNATDFVTFVEQITDKEPSTQELTRIEQSPFTVDLTIQKNSELCMQNQRNCQARDHLSTELKEMREAVAKFAYFKACSTQIELINTIQLMREQVDFARVTGGASPEIYDGHAMYAQELRGWYNYYQDLFFKTTGEAPDLNQCYL